MQFHLTSDYAIRTVLYLAIHSDRVCPTKEICEEMAIPPRYMYKITKDLCKANIMVTVQGVHGGYKLVKNPEDITLFDILSLTEQTMQINGCIEDESYCSRNATAVCTVRKQFERISKVIEEEFRNVSVASLM